MYSAAIVSIAAFPSLWSPSRATWDQSKRILSQAITSRRPSFFLHNCVRLLFTIASLGGLLGLIASFFRSRSTARHNEAPATISWNNFDCCLRPLPSPTPCFSFHARQTIRIFDRYLLPLLAIATLCLVRYYQEQIRRPLDCRALLILFMAAYGITATHNHSPSIAHAQRSPTNSALTASPDTSVDDGWEYNLGAELQHSDHINFPAIAVPAHAYTPVPPPPAGQCTMFWYDYTPHIHPLYGISFDPNACNGPAPFAPVHYSRWPTAHPAPSTSSATRHLPIRDRLLSC